MKLLELEVGVLLKHPNSEDDGPSDASLQVLSFVLVIFWILYASPLQNYSSILSFENFFQFNWYSDFG